MTIVECIASKSLYFKQRAYSKALEKPQKKLIDCTWN